MKISEKILLDRDGLIKYGPINIVVFGDSVTHGAFESGVFDYENVYWNFLRKKINNIRGYVPVNIINAGIGGTTAQDAVERMDSQVLLYKPDLIIVCFGLNDVNGSLKDYLNALETIFVKASSSGCEVIFLTPNMLNTYVADDTDEKNLNYAKVTAEMQNNGKFDLYIKSAVELAGKLNIQVCDCYSEWKKLSEKEDTTALLANRINHPNRKMHELFANSLFDILFPEKETSISVDSAMYNK